MIVFLRVLHTVVSSRYSGMGVMNVRPTSSRNTPGCQTDVVADVDALEERISCRIHRHGGDYLRGAHRVRRGGSGKNLPEQYLRSVLKCVRLRTVISDVHDIGGCVSGNPGLELILDPSVDSGEGPGLAVVGRGCHHEIGIRANVSKRHARINHGSRNLTAVPDHIRLDSVRVLAMGVLGESVHNELRGLYARASPEWVVGNRTSFCNNESGHRAGGHVGRALWCASHPFDVDPGRLLGGKSVDAVRRRDSAVRSNGNVRQVREITSTDRYRSR